jgi:predicted GNAT family N-acyltransferase
VKSGLIVHKVTSKEDLDTVFNIRRKVFVVGQNVDPLEEFDEFEESSHHFLAIYNGVPAGTARWRNTDKGIKLERFAVLDQFRSKGVGSALVKAVEEDITVQCGPGTLLYMHAQVDAMGLYEKYGYQKKGDLFVECDIDHFLMEKLI